MTKCKKFSFNEFHPFADVRVMICVATTVVFAWEDNLIAPKHLQVVLFLNSEFVPSSRLLLLLNSIVFCSSLSETVGNFRKRSRKVWTNDKLEYET